MQDGSSKKKALPVMEIIGAVAAVALLCMQLFWSPDCKPEIRHAVQITFTVLVTISAVLLALKAARKVKENKK